MPTRYATLLAEETESRADNENQINTKKNLKKMKLELEIIAEFAKELGFVCKFDNPNQINIEFSPGIIFVFENIENEDDNVFGFQGTPWHSHDKLILTTENNSYIELKDIEIIEGIQDGTILLCEQYQSGRWEITR